MSEFTDTLKNKSADLWYRVSGAFKDDWKENLFWLALGFAFCWIIF